MRNLLFILIMFIPSIALADDGSFLDYVGNRINDIHYTITQEIPSVFHRFVAWGIEYYSLAVITVKLQTIEFAYLVAKQIATDINISAYLVSSISQMPSGVRWALQELGFANGLNLLINAYITRFVMNIMGW
ncbi:TPA: DUF2523 domain-containing protein [Aeromonas salmonicida]|uniref:DUF2523 family protein n=1 Tax=Aeromonas salmonicida TaxID=645 RepID=UPI000447F72A|nr:DUF2523 family protein [Aeromonas salmonicida]ELI6407671.1 DUF2523 domain-containing protein [Aeromonas salmonicida subsp. salmonicida]ASI23393.1 hypothetical protein CE456_12700 [Aeromonas salmonicida]ASI27709.1 hypothetical protein CE463_12725 [Aeromonas salmonicida]ASI31840.1 hypothetical protein CE462_11675 [Aeromonas salmonicida]ATD39103.1 hypothetical protein BHG40_15135 [Aeromonas salmonicida subsp. masoucida]